MALVLETNYSKKIGLPGFSSHQFSITLKSEITDPTQIQAESVRLYNLLQTSVDQSLKQSGWLPDSKPANGNGNGHVSANGNGHTSHWACSDKQRDLIQKIITENHLEQNQVEQLAVERFGHGLNRLNKLEASGLIDELFEKHGGKPSNRRGQFRPAPAR